MNNSPCASSWCPCSEGPIFPLIPGQSVPRNLQHTQPTLCQGTEVKQLPSRHMFVFSCMTSSPRGFQTWLNTTVPLLSTFQAVLQQDHRRSGSGQSQPCSSPLRQSLCKCTPITVSYEGKSVTPQRTKWDIRDKSIDQPASNSWLTGGDSTASALPVAACYLFMSLTEEKKKNTYSFNCFQ